MIKEGFVINNKYNVIRQLGHGGMAQVWLAEEIKMGNRQVAIKVPLPGVSEKEHRILKARFQRELEVCAELVIADTPNIVKAITVEPYDDDNLLVLEYMKSGDLSRKINASPDGLPLEQIIQIMRETLSALDMIHNHPQAIIHRDIKPSNILFNSQNVACLADFGLAQLGKTTGISQVFTEQSVSFTPLYRAPELSSFNSVACPSSDLYSLGCVFWEMVTGKPYKTNIGIDSRKLRPDVPLSIHIIINDCLHEDPIKRFSSAKQLLDKINDVFHESIHDHQIQIDLGPQYIENHRLFFHCNDQNSIQTAINSISKKSIFIITGCFLPTEVTDRRLAEWLRDHINNTYGNNQKGYESILINDIWWEKHHEIQLNPFITIGGPGVNAVTAKLNNCSQSSATGNNSNWARWSIEDKYHFIWHVNDFSNHSMGIWGDTAYDTIYALQIYLNGKEGLEKFLRNNWS